MREIGIRVAVGARPGNVVKLVFTRSAIVIAAGLLAGLPAGAMAARVLATVMPPVSPYDPVVITGVCATVAAIALGALSGPLRRALHVGPARVLRVE